MRVLNVSQNYFVAGGMDVAMFTLERVLTARGHEVIPFCAADPRNEPTPYARWFPPAPPTEGTGAGSLLRTLYAPAAKAALARLLDAHPVDIVHLHSWFKRLTPAILSELRRRRLPVVRTLHEYRAVCPVSTLYRDGGVCLDCRGGRYRKVLRHRCAGGSLARSAWNYAEMRVADALGARGIAARHIAVSEPQRELLVAMGMVPERLVTIHHPIAVPPPREGRRDGHVLFFGRLEAVKGADLLVDLAARLPGTTLLVAGDGARRAAVEREAAARGVRNVRLAGVLRGEALAAAIAGASCAVVPSLWAEPFGLTVAEALAHATPVVAFAVGGPAATVRDGVDGFLVAPGDAAAMAERAGRLAADPSLVRAMGEAGRARIAADFSETEYYRRTMAAYRAAMGEAPR